MLDSETKRRIDSARDILVGKVPDPKSQVEQITIALIYKFMDYMAEHLTPNGRAAIIVPEGIIFQSAGAYKQLRKYLIENNFLWAVVSLPAGVFNPYAGVKTSILFLDKALAKKTDKVLFVKVENDGLGLGAQRRPIDKDDLPQTLKVLKSFRISILDGKSASFAPESDSALLVSISTLEESDYNLSADRYREVIKVNHHYEMVKLSDVCLINPKKSEVNELDSDTLVSFIPMEDIDEHRMEVNPKRERKIGEVYKGYTYFKENDVLIAKVTPCFENGKGGIARNLVNGIGFGTSELHVLRATDKVLPEYVYWIVNREDFIEKGKNRMTGTGGLQRVPIDYISNLQIPLPPLEIQRQIVDEIAAHQHIIDGARQVVEGWKPDVELELIQTLPDGVDEWEKAKINDVCDFIDYRGKTPNKSESGVRLITAKNVKMGALYDEPREYIADYDSWMTRGIPKKGDVLFTTEGPLGNVAIIDIDDEKFAVGQRIITLQSKDGIILPVYLANILMSKSIQAEIEKYSTGSTVKGILARYFREIEIPLPPLEIQREFIARIETERAIVHGNWQLIRFASREEKVKKVIERVWEG